MLKILKKSLIFILIIAVIMVAFYLSYSAYGAFNRFDVEIADGEYASKDNAYRLSIRGERIILSPPEGKSTVYLIEVVDRNLVTLKNADTEDYAIFTEKGETMYIKSLRLYLYKLEVLQNEQKP